MKRHAPMVLTVVAVAALCIWISLHRAHSAAPAEHSAAYNAERERMARIVAESAARSAAQTAKSIARRAGAATAASPVNTRSATLAAN